MQRMEDSRGAKQALHWIDDEKRPRITWQDMTWRDVPLMDTTWKDVCLEIMYSGKNGLSDVLVTGLASCLKV